MSSLNGFVFVSVVVFGMASFVTCILLIGKLLSGKDWDPTTVLAAAYFIGMFIWGLSSA